MATFPTFNNGVVTQMPYGEGDLYPVTQSYMPCGFAFDQKWNAGAKQMRFGVHFDVMTETEVATLESFWESVGGQLGYFSFTDDNGTIHTLSKFDQPSLEFQYVGPGQCAVQVNILALN